MPTTRVSERGQVVIPKAIRDRLKIGRGQLLEVEEVEGAILMRPQKSAASSRPRGWRGWAGVLKGSGALQDLEAEHRQEIQRDR